MKAAIPNIITLLNLCSGVLAIIMMDLFWSPILIIIAGIFDLLDGAAARALNVTSEIGKQLDSLCDMVSFGVAPALIYWLLVPHPHYAFILVPLIMAASAAYRLAKFNTLPSLPYFIGLATPAYAFSIVGLALGVYWGNPIVTQLMESPLIYVLFGLFISAFMNLNRVMMSTKGWSTPGTKNWLFVFLIVSTILFLIDYTFALYFSIMAYIVINELKEFFAPTTR